jgi:hypothetical protein
LRLLWAIREYIRIAPGFIELDEITSSLTKKSTRKGFLFTRGATSISLFQIVESSPVGRPPRAQFEFPDPSTWRLEVLQTVYIPTHHPKNIQLPTATYIDNNLDILLSVAVLMKGLVDLVLPES